MDLDQVLAELEALGTEKQRALNARHGAPEKQFGLKMGDVRAVAKKLGKHTPLARELWATGIAEAMLLGTLIVRPAELSADELESMVVAATYPQLADWLNSYVVKSHPQAESLRQQWMSREEPGLARSAWSMTADRIGKGAEGFDLGALLDRIEAEMPTAHPLARWTMNFALAAIGIHSEAHRGRALEIGERLGVYRDYPTPKGCTSPFAPIWIREMVRRSGESEGA